MPGCKPDLDASTLDASQPARSAQRVPVLHIVFAGETICDGVRHRMAPGETLIGRRVAAGGISLAADEQASREHARLTVKQERVTVEDLGSRNGVYVAAKRIRGPVTLADGDVIRCGSTLAVFRLARSQQPDYPIGQLIGDSHEMRAVRLALKRVATATEIVLIRGETGCGKELAARAIHELSGRKGPLVAVNCAAIVANLFESQLFGHVAGAFSGAGEPALGYFRAASDGTLLLDELGEIPLELQAKLLRALETGSVVPVGATEPVLHHTRVVAATNADLDQAVAAGRFREDLYARIAQLTIDMPPLRSRREDVLRLLQHFLGDHPPLAPSLAEALLNHEWPRNVRELSALASELRITAKEAERLELEPVRARLASTVVAHDEVATASSSIAAAPASAPTASRETLARLLAEHDGNISAVARALRRSRTQTYRLIEQHGLVAEAYRSD